MSTSSSHSFPLDLVRCDLRELLSALDEGVVTSVSLVKEYIRELAHRNVEVQLMSGRQSTGGQHHWT